MLSEYLAELNPLILDEKAAQYLEETQNQTTHRQHNSVKRYVFHSFCEPGAVLHAGVRGIGPKRTPQRFIFGERRQKFKKLNNSLCYKVNSKEHVVETLGERRRVLLNLGGQGRLPKVGSFEERLE